LLAPGCVFHADDSGVRYECSDGACPGGLSCSSAGLCEPPADLGALTCDQPDLATLSTTLATTGSTIGRANTVAAACAGGTLDGPDAVFQVDAAIGSHLNLTFLPSGTDPATNPIYAYVLYDCAPPPENPACVGLVLANVTTPQTITVTQQPQYVVVDSPSASDTGGRFTLYISAD
jgi:hypothetical protein